MAFVFEQQLSAGGGQDVVSRMMRLPMRARTRWARGSSRRRSVGRHTHDWPAQRAEAVLHDVRADLAGRAAGAVVPVDDDAAASAANRLLDRRPVHRDESARVHHLAADALVGQCLRGRQPEIAALPDAHDGHVSAGSRRARDAQLPVTRATRLRAADMRRSCHPPGQAGASPRAHPHARKTGGDARAATPKQDHRP
jgi:hypothetical protein